MVILKSDTGTIYVETDEGYHSLPVKFTLYPDTPLSVDTVSFVLNRYNVELLVSYLNDYYLNEEK